MATLACAQNLKFNANGKFKIVQFTDVHYIFNDSRSEIAIERINEILNAENPDLMMFTGDVIYGKPAKESMCTVLEQVLKRKIPFAVILGITITNRNYRMKNYYKLFKVYHTA